MEIGNFGYYWLDTWVMSNVIQLATQDFCRRYLNRSNDPCGRQYDQMTQAARSVPANIAEGNSRHDTSKETEMRLTDVARASLAELANDYLNWLLQHEELPWSVKSDIYCKVSNTHLDKPLYKDDVQYLSSQHILVQKHKFDEWLEAKNSIVAANCLLVLCNRLIMMLRKQLANQLETFRAEGGFTEALTAERLAFRAEQSANANAPVCPKCGKPMLKRMARKGINSGKEFWSCSVRNRRHAPSLAYTGVNRHASATRIGLMDSTVPVEAMVGGVIHPRQGMPVCSGCPRAVSNPRRGFMFNGLQGENCCEIMFVQ